MSDETMRRRFRESLPWYVNGTLGDDERAWIDAYVRENPEARQEVELVRLLHDEVAATATERRPDAGLDDLLRRVRQTAGNRSQRSWWQRFNDFFSALPLSPALAAGLILVQAGMIATLVLERGGARDESMGLARSAGPETSTGPVVRVNFKPNATEADIRSLLLRSGWRIVGGPGQLGAYFLAANPERFMSAVADLRASPWIDSAEVLPQLPERSE